MAYHLLTVDHSHAVGDGVQVAPVVRLGRLVDDGPKEIKPMKGDPVELRLPDGPIRQAVITAFGLDGWMKDGYPTWLTILRCGFTEPSELHVLLVRHLNLRTNQLELVGST